MASRPQLARLTGALELAGVCVDLAGRRVLSGVDLNVGRGEVVGLIGPNGGGKTTLMRASLGLARLAAGEVRLSGESGRGMSERRRAQLAAWLPQQHRVSWNLVAWRVAALGAPEAPLEQARAAAMQALADVGAEDLAERGVAEMSGGETARVLLARLLVTQAPLILADEPAAGLDPGAQLHVMQILRRRAERGAAVLVSLHDLTLALRACDRLVVLSSGRVIAQGLPHGALSAAALTEGFGLQGGIVETAFGPVLSARLGDPTKG